MSKLKAVKPKATSKRLKLFVYGKAGVGKTTATIQFPNAYIIDTEKGSENYAESINKVNSVVFKSNDFQEIKEQLGALLTEKHDYRTLIIDPITVFYQSIQEYWIRKFEYYSKSEKDKDMQDYGMRYWGRVKSDYKAIMRLIMKLDMNVLITAHQKDLYGNNMSKIGVTFDSMKGDDYFFDYIFRLECEGNKRIAFTEKERCEVGKSKFPASFEWKYDNFRKFYGTELEREAKVVELAKPESIKELKRLIEVINIPQDNIDKWLNKSDASSFEEMEELNIQKCIEFCRKKINDVSDGRAIA